ncbi:polymorphic outer membrane protein [Methanothermus fervidus DSM 2088]|uniref:Polymorphic outer membrane protein n=1 Tax=Methanothermus fervidus (strain ATCC 43054 / DSM 2088 / JCM 10308 / V24 S) TaxID=523846 RepID=E3GWI2_METFV|nr:polymorphic outer membrane protein [Methanothermus fervidus DSM 2088]
MAISQAYGVKEVYPGNSTLKDVIKYSNPGETIFMHNGTYYASGIVIDKNLTIVGEDKDGVVIDAQREGPIFTIFGGANVRLINLTLTNGNGTEGGAINNNGYLVVENCKFKDNYASEDGGAIYNYGYENSPTLDREGYLEVKNCSFENNYASKCGGAISNSVNLTVYNSIFRNNLACYHGGAIDNGIDAPTNLTKCLFVENRAKYKGGAIDNAGGLTIDKCKFENNSASVSGGAINNPGGSIIINNCIFDNNVATRGGAIITDEDDLTITNTIFKYNKAKLGGAIYVSAFREYPNISVDNSNVFFNNIPDNIHYESLDYNITLTNTGKSKITIKYYITVYTNPDDGKKVSYKELTITLKPNETKTINLGKYLRGYAVSGTMIVKNPSKNGIPLNLRIKYEIEGFNPQMREISKYIAPRGEFRYIARYALHLTGQGHERGFIDIW